MEIDFTILNKTTFLKLQSKAALLVSKEKPKIFDVYAYFSTHPRKLEKTDDLIAAISIAYSWMPTMLDILDNDEKSLKSLSKEIRGLSTIKSNKKLQEKEIEIKQVLIKLSRATNNSVIGASKVLHLFYPTHVPIFDSRVTRAWNHLFRNKMRIPTLSQKNQADSYFKYWLALLYWKEKLSKPGVRDIEKLLFDYGGYLKTQKNAGRGK
jgi:hypothetical protein